MVSKLNEGYLDDLYSIFHDNSCHDQTFLLKQRVSIVYRLLIELPAKLHARALCISRPSSDTSNGQAQAIDSFNRKVSLHNSWGVLGHGHLN